MSHLQMHTDLSVWLFWSRCKSLCMVLEREQRSQKVPENFPRQRNHPNPSEWTLTRERTQGLPVYEPVPWNSLPLPTFKPLDSMRGRGHPGVWMPLFYLLFIVCSLQPTRS